MAVEFRDEDTGAHIERIGRFSVLLAEHIGMDAEFCERLRHAAPLHDVGKVAIPDAILLKPGPLTPEERAIVETHAEEGHRLVRGSSSSILDMAATIALSHQEKWDGSGYPRGLKGEAIPIEGRIVAVADVFDALTSDRVYRKAFSVEEAIQMMREQRGRHFDPVLLDAFMEVLGRTGPDAREELRARPRGARRGDARDLRDRARTRRRRDGRGRDRDRDRGRHHADHAARRGDRARRCAGSTCSPTRASSSADTEHRAATIVRRVLATLYRYMTGGTEPTRERVLLAGVKGDEHTLGLQMVHDQLAAAGFQTVFDTDLDGERLLELVESRSPDLIVLGATAAGEDGLDTALRELRASHPALPIVLVRPRRRRQPAPRARRHARARAHRRVGRGGRRAADRRRCGRLGTGESRRPRFAHARVAPVSKRAIVTGGAGFIGSHVVDALLADGYEVHVIDDLSSGAAERVPVAGRAARARHRRRAGAARASSSESRRRPSTTSPRRRAWSPRCRTPAATATSTCGAR